MNEEFKKMQKIAGLITESEYKEKTNEIGDLKLLNKNNNDGLNKFIEQFIKGLDNPIIMSTLYRMMDTNSFTKFGHEIFTFSDEERKKLEEIKPLLNNLVDTVSKIKNMVGK